MSRKFTIQVLDPTGTDAGDVVFEYPIPTYGGAIHNGLGGGIDTPVPTKGEAAEIKRMLRAMIAELSKKKPTEKPISEKPEGQIEETQNDK